LTIDAGGVQPLTSAALPNVDDMFGLGFSQIAVLEQIAEGVIITDALGRIMFVNPAAEALHGVKMLGVTPEQYSETYHLFTDLGEPFPPAELPLARAVQRGETVANVRWRIQRPDGSVVRAIGSARPLIDLQRHQIGAVLTLRDDTARIEAEEAQRQSEERLSLAQAAARIGTYDYDLADGRMFWSSHMFSIYGVPHRQGAVSLDEWRDLVHPADRDATNYITTFGPPEAGKSYIHEYRIVRPDGSIRWIEARAVVHGDEHGRPSRIIGVNLDITERKAVEEALEESRSRLVLAQRAARAVTWEWDLAANEVLWNDLPTARELAGEDLGERTPFDLWLLRIHPEDVEKHLADAAAAIAAGRGSMAFRITVCGETRWLETSGQVSERDDCGTPTKLAGITLDITARMRAEEHQQLLIGELNHRAKNLLAIIQGVAHQTLKNMPAEDRQAFDGRLRALAAAHTLLTRGNWESADIREVIYDTVAAICPTNDRVEIEGPAVLLRPKTAVSLAMAVHELTTNALKYGSLSVTHGRVGVRWQVAGDRLHLQWCERGGPRVFPPDKRGFGTRMIERGLAAELAGAVRIDFHAEGLVCTIDAPLPTADA
jgi:PAS domain S-box-containing protein